MTELVTLGIVGVVGVVVVALVAIVFGKSFLFRYSGDDVTAIVRGETLDRDEDAK